MQQENKTNKAESEVSDTENTSSDSAESIISVSSANDSDNSISTLNSSSGKSVVDFLSHISNINLNRPDDSNFLNINHPTNFRESVINPNFSGDINQSRTEIKADLNMTTLNIDQMLKIIPEFNGSSKQLDKFIACCEIVYNPLTNKEDQKLFLNILKSKLGQKPFDIIKYQNFESWKDLKTEFLLQFADTRPVEQLQVELVQLRQQRIESVREFASKIEQLLSDLNNACIAREGEDAAKHIKNLNSITALNTFQNGLRQQYQLIVKACRFTKLKDAISKAIEEEASMSNVHCGSSKIQLNNNYRNSFTNYREKCQLCSRIGHIAKHCYSFTKPNQDNNSNNANSITKLPITNSSSNYNKNISDNHQSTNLEMSNNYRTNKCNYCKNVGHNIKDCRKREFNNRKSVYLQNSNNNFKPGNSTQSTSTNSVNYSQSNLSNAVVRASEI